MRTKAVLFFLLLLPVYVVNGQDDKREYLKKVLDNLEQIKSATYKVESEVWNPGDTIPSSIRTYFHTRIYLMDVQAFMIYPNPTTV